MSKELSELVSKIISATEKHEWVQVDRLTLVLRELVKVEVAAIEGKKQ